MSQGNDIFDLLSGPTPAAQQPLQSLQFNMAAPAPSSSSSGTFSPNYDIDFSSLGEMQSGSPSQPSTFGQLDQQKNSLPFSPTSQQNSSVFGQFPQQPNSHATQQASGQIPGQQSHHESTSIFGAGGQNSNQQPSSLFGQMHGNQSTQQSASLLGQSSQQPSSLFGQSTPSGSAPFGNNTQPPTNFGQGAPAASTFVQNTQSTPSFGQCAQPNLQFGQSTQSNSPFGHMTGAQSTQPNLQFGQSTQSNSPFGHMSGGQGTQPNLQFGQNTQSNSPFGHMSGGQSTQPNSQFGQSTQSNSPFGQITSGQGTQPNLQFGQSTQSNSPFGQITGGQGTQPNLQFGQSTQSNSSFGQMVGGQPMSQFGAFPTTPGNVGQTGMNNFQTNSAFPTMAGMQNSAAQQVVSDPFAIFSNKAGSESSTGAANTDTKANSDDFFAVFSSPETSTKPTTNASIPKSSSTSALDDPFFSAFSQSTSVADTPVPASTSNSTAAVDSVFDPFGLMSPEKQEQPQAPPQTQSQQQEEAPFEPSFDVFSSPPAKVDSTSETLHSSTNDKDEGDGKESDEAEEQDEDPPLTNEGDKTEVGNETVKQEITDPVLREISDKFGGRWRLVRSDPYDEFLKSVGVGLVHRKRAGKGNPEQSVNVMPDGQIHVTVRSTLHSQSYIFKLNEETENTVEKAPQSVFCSYSNGKLFLQMTPCGDAFGKTQEVERFINSKHEMVQIHSAGVASCRRFFAKVDGVAPKITSPQTSDSKEEEPTSPKATTIPTTQAPQLIQQAPPSPKIQPKSSENPPSNPPKSPLTVVDLSQSVAALEMPTQDNSPPDTTTLTPGQLLLQNLKGDGTPEENKEDEVQSKLNDDEDTLIFTTGTDISEESEA